MVNKPAEKTEAQDDLNDIKRKLAWRMGAAGLMIVGLLGGLALFDRYSAPAVTEPSEPQFTEPVPVPKKMVTQPVTPVEAPVVEAPKDESKPAEPEASAPPIDSSARLAEPPPRPEVPAQPALPRASQPAARPTTAAAPASPSKASEPKPATLATPASRPAEPTTPQQPAQATPPVQAALSRLFKGFALQAGVFTDPRRAEELHAKLMLEGIPSSIESRVEVGPFKTRAEAEAARAKMKSLGIDTVLLLPKGSKR